MKASELQKTHTYVMSVYQKASEGVVSTNWLYKEAKLAGINIGIVGILTSNQLTPASARYGSNRFHWESVRPSLTMTTKIQNDLDKMKTRITKNETAKIKDLLSKGKPVAEVARLTNVPYHKVYYIDKLRPISAPKTADRYITIPIKRSWLDHAVRALKQGFKYLVAAGVGYLIHFLLK